MTIDHFEHAGPHHEQIDLPTPEELFARLFDGSTALRADEWSVETSRLTERAGTGADGKPMLLRYSELTLRRNE